MTDVDAFNDDAPLTNADDILKKEYVEVELGTPDLGGPPDCFVCPLNGRA